MRTYGRWEKLLLTKFKSHFSSTRAAKFKNHCFESKRSGTENVALTTKILSGSIIFSYEPSVAEFQWIRMSTCWVIVNLITNWSTCKPFDVTILNVVVVYSEPILSVVFWFFKCWYLWNQIKYKKLSMAFIHVFHTLSYEKIKVLISYPL